jgi:hypothetical protein
MFAALTSIRTEVEGLDTQRQKRGVVSLSYVLRLISDDKSLSIFQLIGDINFSGEISRKKLGLSRKQYNPRIESMMTTGLIKRHRGIYSLSPFGKVIYCCIMIAKNALNNYYSLKIIEHTESSGFSDEELGKLVNALIDNQQVKEFLAKKC